MSALAALGRVGVGPGVASAHTGGEPLEVTIPPSGVVGHGDGQDVWPIEEYRIGATGAAR